MKKTQIVIQVILFLFISFLTASCSLNEKNDEGNYYQDFDNLKMWDRNSQVTNERAHSGKYCTYTDSSHEFSQTFEIDLASDLSQRYKSVQVTAWCMKVKKDTKAVLGVRLENQGKVLVTETSNFDEALELPDTWINQVLILKFPKDAPADCRIKVFCWSPDKEKAFVDDVGIELRK